MKFLAVISFIKTFIIYIDVGAGVVSLLCLSIGRVNYEVERFIEGLRIGRVECRLNGLVEVFLKRL